MEYKTDLELLEIVKAGGRVSGNSLHKEEAPEKCNGVHSRWRTLVCCQGEEDVIECERCGCQKVVACNFDDEYD